ncbi:MAG: hypothetical protein WDW36_009572 [Sanguina aurantia]
MASGLPDNPEAKFVLERAADAFNTADTSGASSGRVPPDGVFSVEILRELIALSFEAETAKAARALLVFKPFEGIIQATTAEERFDALFRFGQNERLLSSLGSTDLDHWIRVKAVDGLFSPASLWADLLAAQVAHLATRSLRGRNGAAQGRKRKAEQQEGVSGDLPQPPAAPASSAAVPEGLLEPGPANNDHDAGDREPEHVQHSPAHDESEPRDNKPGEAQQNPPNNGTGPADREPGDLQSEEEPEDRMQEEAEPASGGGLPGGDVPGTLDQEQTVQGTEDQGPKAAPSPVPVQSPRPTPSQAPSTSSFACRGVAPPTRPPAPAALPSAPTRSTGGAGTSSQARQPAVVPQQGSAARARESGEGGAGYTEPGVVPVDPDPADHARDLCGAMEAGPGQTGGNLHLDRVYSQPTLGGSGSEEGGSGQGGGLRVDRAPAGEIPLEGGELRGGGWEAAGMERRDAHQEIAAHGPELHLEVGR